MAVWFRTPRHGDGSLTPRGFLFQAVGAGATFYGIHSIYAPAAWVILGLAAIVVGEKT